MRKVLVVEDEKEISDLLEIHLADLNCEVTKADDGRVGLDFAINDQFDLIVLDIMLPNLDGIEICKEVRKREIYVPILMLTAKSEEFDKVLGLEIGADDYLTKPFSIREFIARVKAVFRRIDAVQKTDSDNSIINIGDLKIDSQKRRVILKGNRVELTQKEFDLLHLMATHPGRTYTREQLLNTVWGYQYNGYEHTVNSHINRLRTKIEDDLSNPRFIRTSWGVGYWFNDTLEN